MADTYIGGSGGKWSVRWVKPMWSGNGLTRWVMGVVARRDTRERGLICSVIGGVWQWG